MLTPRWNDSHSMHNHVPSHGQLQPRPHPSSASRPIQPPRYSTTRGAQLLVNHTPPALANWQEFPSLPGKSKAVPIINPQTGTAHASLVSAQEQPALSKQYPDGRGRICSTAVDGKAGHNSGAQRDSPTESSSREFNIYARPFVPEAFSIINELIPPEGRDIHTKGAKEIDCEVYIGRCIPRDFLPDIPLPIESPMTSPFDLVDGVMHTDYETYFQFHIEAEIRSQMLENETYTLFGHAIKDPIHDIRDPIQDPLGFTTCSILVPGLRENSPYVEEDDVIELRELIYDQSGRLRGMEHWLAQLSQFYGNKPWPPRWRNELSPGWTGFIYHARVLAVQRKDNTLVIRIDQSPDAWRWALPFRESPRFNIQFPVAMARYQPMKLALPIIQKALRHADKTRYHLTNNVRSPPNTPWLQSMLFPVEKDCDKQISLNPGNFKQKFFDDQLNWEQKKAIGSICSRDYGVLPFLISGPPGTGKTKTLVEVALQLIKYSDGVSHILFCAPSDQAADMIVQRTSSHFSKGELLRLNRSSRTFAEVPGAVLPYCWVLEDKFDLPDFQLLMACKLVVTTCRDASLLLYSRVSNTDLIAAESGLRCAINPDATPPTMFQLHWTALIIDEAAQAIEPEALIPLSVVAPLDSVKIKSLPLVIMAGDEHQLGPRTSLPSSPLKTSLFARLFARPVYANHVLSRGQAGEREPKILNRSMLPIARPAFANLIRNYRSHPAILAVPSSLFYFDTLEPEAADTDCLASWSGWRGRKWPVLLHNNNFEDSMDLENGGWHNAGEAQIACKYAAELVQSGLVAQKDICIMSPFKAQVACLRRIMRRPRFGSLWDIDIGPTEAFQGLERSVVILCTTRSKQQFVESDKKANWGVIGMPNVMNVALTRAKYGLIVIGKRDTLFLDANWRAFLEFCERNGLVNGEDSRPVQDKSNTKPSTRLEKVLLAREEEPNESRVLKVYSQEDEMWTFGMQAALDAGSSDSYELSDDGEGNDEYEYGENEEV